MKTPRTDAVVIVQSKTHDLYMGPVTTHQAYVPADFARELERENDMLRRTQPINTHRRLFDLVRFMRTELHRADLITEEEYAWLCGHEFSEDKNVPGSPSVRRLEDYDGLRDQLQVAQEEAGILLADSDEKRHALEHQLSELSAVLLATRQTATSAMNEIRLVVGAPLGCDDETDKRAADYVRDLRTERDQLLASMNARELNATKRLHLREEIAVAISAVIVSAWIRGDSDAEVITETRENYKAADEILTIIDKLHQ